MLINAAGVLVAAKHITKWVTGGGVRMYVHCPVHEGCTMYMVYEVYTYRFIFLFIILKLKNIKNGRRYNSYTGHFISKTPFLFYYMQRVLPYNHSIDDKNLG